MSYLDLYNNMFYTFFNSTQQDITGNKLDDLTAKNNLFKRANVRTYIWCMSEHHTCQICHIWHVWSVIFRWKMKFSDPNVTVLILSNIIIYKVLEFDLQVSQPPPSPLPPSPWSWNLHYIAHVFIYNPKSVFDLKAQL